MSIAHLLDVEADEAAIIHAMGRREYAGMHRRAWLRSMARRVRGWTFI
jgi:hypothetical protein